MANPKKPTALRLVNGNPSRRPLPKKEPKPKAGKIKKPKNLTPQASKVWDSLCELLDSIGVLTIADSLALERLCECYSEIKKADIEIKKYGIIYKVKTSTNDDEVLLKPNPAVTQRADADRRFKAYLIEFGLTPSARTKIEVIEKEEDSNSDRFFK